MKLLNRIKSIFFSSEIDPEVLKLHKQISEKLPNYGTKRLFSSDDQTINYGQVINYISRGIAVEFMPITNNVWLNFTLKNLSNINYPINYRFRVKPQLTLEEVVCYLTKGEIVYFVPNGEIRNSNKIFHYPKVKLNNLTTKFIKSKPQFYLFPNED